jgi:hypothetical protein
MSVDRSFVERNRTARERLATLVEGLGNNDLGRDLGNGWTVATTLAHLAFYDRRALVLLDKWQRTGASPAPSPMDVHVINDTLSYLTRLIPPRAAANEAIAAAAAVDQSIEGLDDVKVSQALATDTPRLDRSAHRIEHAEEIARAIGR